MAVKLFPPDPVQRLVDVKLPYAGVADVQNTVLQKVLQLPEIGWRNCTPQMAGVKLRESFAHIPAPHLIQNVGHAKRWIKEKITGYVDGELITFLRKPKYIVDAIKVIQYAARLVATLRFLEGLLQKEVELANAWASECNQLLAFGKANITPAGLANQGENILREELDVAIAAVSQQISENTQNISCLI